MTTHNGLHSAEDELLDQAILEFLRADAIGQAGDQQKWLDRYPACAAGLMRYFEDRQRVDCALQPVRLEWSSSVHEGESAKPLDDVNLAVRVETIEYVPSPDQLAGTRYHTLRFHARGGMGEIWLAEDKRIGRQVALKKLRAGRKDRQARFLVEAQVTGQLEHPSVVPLHDMGVDETGDPYYVMKFIQGRPLSEVIADFHAQKPAVDWAGDLQFLRLLQAFIDICNAVAYAHSRGVLHRDIKPDNVMLGAFGETMVVDWGLAKIIGQPDQLRQTSVRLSGGASTATQDGAIVGSPLYMSPEGADGRLDDVDQRSDVYLLGATLYEILTARPPRQASSQSELINLARKCRPTDPRKIDHRIPRPLEAICLKAMAHRKGDRYAMPQALADDVQRFLASEPTTAYKEPMLVRLGRWVRRHRRGILRSAAILCVAALGGLAFYSSRRARILSEREVARDQFTQFTRLADQAQFFAATNDAAMEKAPYYDLSRAIAMGTAALAIAIPWQDGAQQFPLIDQRPELLRTRYALLLRMAQIKLQRNQPGANPSEAMSLLDQAKSVPPLSRDYHQLRGLCLEQLGEDQSAQDEIRLANKSDVPEFADDHFLQAETLRSQDAGSAAQTVAEEAAPSRDYLARAMAEYRAALALDPRHYWARFQLGRCLLALGQSSEAIEALSSCIALRPESPWAYSARGLAYACSGQTREALADLDLAVRLDANFQPARLNRGFVQWLQGNRAEALADFDAILAAPADQRLNEAQFYRGQLLLQQHKDREALADFAKVAEVLPNFRPTYWYLAQAQFRLAKYEAGEGSLQKFIALGMYDTDKQTVAQKHFLTGKSLRLLALHLDGDARKESARRAVDQLRSAMAAGDTDAEVYQHLGAAYELLADSTHAIESYTWGLAAVSDNVVLLNLRGWAYSNSDQPDAARKDFEKSIYFAPNNSESHTGLGYTEAAAGANDAARSEIAAALLSGADDYRVLHNVACIYGQLAQSNSDRKLENEDFAIAALKRALTLYRQKPSINGKDEIEMIRREKRAFTDSLRARPEFQLLLTQNIRSN